RPAATLSRNRPHLAVTIPTSQPIARGSQIPIAPRATPFYPRRPAVSSLEAFRTPASVHPLAPPFGRHPKTLNDSGLLRHRAGAGKLDRGLPFAVRLTSTPFWIKLRRHSYWVTKNDHRVRLR